ncbi:MAG: permease-like cell division protein FtsX [Candidatus Sumerlaeota bacterium]|nr:permease-like cell division protein FtsX [Candidatus Sumerlaeota bacterium]
MVETPQDITRSTRAGGASLVLLRWHGLIPAIMVLGLLSAIWGMVSLTLGYWTRMAEEMDKVFPVVVALKDDATNKQAGALADKLKQAPGIRSASVISAEEALKNILHSTEGWAKEIEAMESKRIPPALNVIIKNGVRDRGARNQGVQQIRDLSGPLLDFIWPDGADLAVVRQKMEETFRFASVLQWGGLLILLLIWAPFLLVDLRHFVFAVGQDRAENYPSENMLLRRFGPTVLRGLLISAGAAILALAVLALAPMAMGASIPAWAMQAANLHAAAFAFGAGLLGHAALSLILWTSAHRPPKVSITI